MPIFADGLGPWHDIGLDSVVVSFESVPVELTIPPLIVPCVMVFVGHKLVKARAVRVSLCGALIPLKSVDTLVVLADVPAVDGYWISFAMTGNTDRLFTLVE